MFKCGFLILFKCGFLLILIHVLVYSFKASMSFKQKSYVEQVIYVVTFLEKIIADFVMFKCGFLICLNVGWWSILCGLMDLACWAVPDDGSVVPMDKVYIDWP